MSFPIAATLGVPERRAGLLAEFALAADSVQEFRTLCVEQLQGWLGVDQASMQSASPLGDVGDVAMIGYDGFKIEGSIPLWMAELTPAETNVLCRSTVTNYRTLFTRKRLQTLRVYHDLMHPLGAQDSVTSIWRTASGLSALSISQADELGPSKLEALQELLPSIRLADGYVQLSARCGTEGTQAEFADWAQSVGLSAREAAVAAMAVRGLQNPEISQLLGVSVFTVRNQLSSVFRKARVTSRTELTFVSADRATSAAGPPPEWIRNLNRHLCAR